MERARALIEPYTRMEGVRGVYLVGSATRPWRDAISDYDFEVAVEDEAFERVPMEQRHTFVFDEGPPRRVDYEFFLRPWSELVAMRDSARDLDHYPFAHAIVLHDPTGELAEALRALARLPEEVRWPRLRVHYFEFFAGVRRATKQIERAHPLDTRLVVGDAVRALAQVLF